jgi:excisionase family DNA binding protein
VRADPSQLLTPADVAELARVSVKTVYRAIRSGALVAIEIGNRYRVSPEDYCAWIEGLTVVPGNATTTDRFAARPPQGSLIALRAIEEAPA